MKNTCIVKKIISSFAILWISFIFLISLPYKFTLHPETQYIFGTIGEWMKGILGESIGAGFSNYAAYVIGSGELLISIILLSAVGMYILKAFGFLKNKGNPEGVIGIGALGATMIMSGAIFFHLFTPLGTEVNNDGGSLFRSAVSIWVLGVALLIAHFKSLVSMFKKS